MSAKSCGECPHCDITLGGKPACFANAVNGVIVEMNHVHQILDTCPFYANTKSFGKYKWEGSHDA